MVKRLNPPLLEFGNGRRFTDPIEAFARVGCGPYRVPGKLSEGVEIIPVAPAQSSLCKWLLYLLKELVRGVPGTKWPRNRYSGFRQAFGVKPTLGTTIEYASYDDVKGVVEDVSRTKDLDKVIIAVAVPEHTTGCGEYQSLKIHAIDRAVRTQFLTGPALQKFFSAQPDDRGQFIWNVALAIASKLEVRPWKLLTPLEGIRCVIGLNTVTARVQDKYQKVGVTALQVWNDWGDCTGSFYAKHNNLTYVRGRLQGISDGDITEILRPALSEHVERPATGNTTSGRDDEIIFHTTDIYANDVYDAIEECLDQAGIVNWKIVRIRQQSIQLQYDPSADKASSKWPWAGTWDYIVPNRRAYLYTAGAWKYYTTAPYVISAHLITPLEAILVRGSNGTTLEEYDLRHIYELTRLAYYTGDIPRVKEPITTKLGRRGASLVMCGLNKYYLPISYLY